jgi:hypothetical protein
MENLKQWAKHEPSEGENLDEADEHRTTKGLEEKIRSPQAQEAAASAPTKADPQAAEKNREFVEDTAMEYDEAEKSFAEGDRGQT